MLLPKQIIELKHLSEPLRQWIRRVAGEAVRTAGTAGAVRFLQLLDAFPSYTGRALQFLRVNAAGNGIDTAFPALGITDEHFGSIVWPEGENGITHEVTDDGGTEVTLTTRYSELTARAVCLVNMDLTGTETVDGVNLANGDVALCVAQTTASENGLWVVGTPWARPSGWAPVPNQRVTVREGAVFKDTVWHLTNNTAPTVGTDAQTWERLPGLIVTDAPDSAWTIPDHYGDAFIKIPTLSAARIYTLPANPRRGQVLTFQYGPTPPAQATLRRSGSQTINGGTADVGLTVSTYRRAVAVFDGAGWYLNSYTAP